MRVGPGPIIHAAAASSAADTPQRWSSAERAAVYRRLFGAPAASADEVQSNRRFSDLWLRFVTSVAQFSRQSDRNARLIALDLVRTTSHDFAAGALPRIDAARSQQDGSSADDRVAMVERGGAASTARSSALEHSGGAVLEWVASHRAAIDELQGNDRSLLDAVEQWLAVTGTSDDAVEAYAAPGEASARVDAWSRALLGALDIETRVGTKQPGNAPRLLAVFVGAPTTGKTLAAHWVAGSLGLEVLRVDLAQVASKYIGETEKNLDRVFDDARRAGAVLLFDEADALFGRRTDVRDAHDRYANIEVDYLLQRIERYEGMAIVTTNTSTQIDPDLLRRAHATVVTFPIPPR